MKIVICEDNNEHANKLISTIYTYFNQRNLSTPHISYFMSGDEFLSSNIEFDIVFLDIEMPGSSGIYIGNYISEKRRNTIIIMITSYMEYLDDAMRFNVFRYLSKPLDSKRLYRCLDDALRAHTLRQSKKITCEKDSKTIVLSSDDIILIETLGRKIIIHTIKDNIETTGSIKYWQEQLPSDTFSLCHRCYLVNLLYVTELDHEQVILANGKYKIYLSQRKVTEFKQQLMHYIEYAK